MRPLGAWRTLSALVLVTTVAACQAVTQTPVGSGNPSATSGSTSPATSPATTPVAARWDGAGSLALGRASTHAVRLADGRVLVVGNENICTPGGAWDDSIAAEVFDPANRTWTGTGSLDAPRDGFVAVALPDGQALVAGGMTSADPPGGVYGAFSSAKLYDPRTGAWSATGPLAAARYAPAAALLADGTVLVAGGTYFDSATTRVLASAEIYDPAAGSWSPTGDLGAARGGARAVTLADGRVLLAGGSGPNGGDQPFASTEIYDPSAGTWTAAGHLALARTDFSLVALSDGGALVAGGTVVGAGGAESPSASAERFDPRTLRWSATGSMVAEAANRAAVVLGDGRVLVAGGIGGRGPEHDGGPGDRPAIDGAELYDPATGAWSATALLPEPREGAAVVRLADGSVLLVGGDGGYVGEPRAPWCPDPIAAALRYVPEGSASLPATTPGPVAADLAMSDVPRAAASPAEATKAATAINAFGLDLYRRLLADGTLTSTEGAVVSPTSIASPSRWRAPARRARRAAGGCTGPLPARTSTLRLDRPFLFVLRDVETGAILFMGRVVDPSAT